MAGSTNTRCCIAGGGPAGMMLGLLLARAGVEVVVLEKHGDFLRDFRGDTIHPSTLEVLDELGLIEALLARPHRKVDRLEARFGDRLVPVADLRRLPVRHPYIAFLPQWDFLDLLAGEGARQGGFALRMSCEATGLIVEDGRVRGVRTRDRAYGAEGEVRADLTVAADGRDSALRGDSGLPLEDLGAPMDVLWFRIERPAGFPDQPLAHFAAGRILVMIDRGDYWQCGYVVSKGMTDTLRARPIQALKDELARLVPGIGPQLARIGGWDELKRLDVQVNRLRRWHRPGLLCIGDAAHAMSPVGGVGINLAIQDAVAAANLLAGPLREGDVREEHLQRVQSRRWWPTRVTQGLQVLVQERLISRVLDGQERVPLPLAVRALQRLPVLRRLPARVIGLGVRPEHVETPAVEV